MTNNLVWNTSDPTEPATLGHHRHEPVRANRALRDYCSLDNTRSLKKLLQHYADNPTATTHSLDTLKTWSATYAWTARAFCFDELQRRSDNRAYAERRRSIIETGLALKHERIEKLKLAYAQLEPCLSDPEFAWSRQVKKLPTPDGGFELVETRRFNAEIYTQLRGLLADLARETSQPDDPFQPDSEHRDLSRLTSQELEILSNLISKISVKLP
jgi:hypothetical protein